MEKIGIDDFQLLPQDTKFQQHYKLRQSQLYHCNLLYVLK